MQGFARGCKSGISKRVSLLWVAACCTGLRSQWYQSGIRSTCSPEFANSKKGISRLPFPPPPGRRIRPPRESSRGPFATPPLTLSLPCLSARRKCGCQPRRRSRGLMERPLFRVGPVLLPTAVPPAPLLLQRRAKKLASFAQRALSSQLLGCQRLKAEGSLLGKVHPFRARL